MADGTPYRLAVLIDAENMPAKYADAIFAELAKYGEASVRRLYGDLFEGSTKPWLETIAELSIAPFHQPKATVGKNASDIALVIDTMDLLHSGRFEAFVLVSSDSDFTKLAQRIREQGVDVYGVGEDKTPDAFKKACKQFITVENLEASEESAPKSAAQGKKPVNHAYQLISNVIKNSSDPDDWTNAAWLGSQLIKQYPEFDTRSYGHKSLAPLIRATGKFEESAVDGILRFRAKK